MRTACFALMVLILFVSCSQDIQAIKYIGDFPEDKITTKRTYIIEVPKGGKLIKGGALITGDYHTEYRIIYPDSSIIYITINEWRGSTLNFDNLNNIGINGYTKQHLLDTISNSGLQLNGMCWRENVLGDVVVGYINVPTAKRELYDVVLASLRRKN